jgi:hypothetical protein
MRLAGVATETEFIQPEQVANLRRSKKIVGELQPVLWDDRTKRPISGNHRVKAGWKSIKHIRTKDDMEFWRLKMHSNLQRSVSMTEFAAELGVYAQVMEKAGVKPDGIVKELLEVSPFNTNYTYEFIPNRYKRSEGYAPRIRKSEFAKEVAPKEGEPPVAIKEPDEHFLKQHRCPNCGVMLRITPTGFEIV